MDRWLDRLSDWQYVAVMAGACSLIFTAEALIATLVLGIGLTPFIYFGCAVTLMVCAGGLAGKRWRNRQAMRS